MRNPAPLLGEVAPEEEEDTEDRAEGDEEEAGETQRRGVLPAAAVHKDSVFDDTDFYHELLRELSASLRILRVFGLTRLLTNRGPI
jgi:hypothetical protein